jgi:hypothetical protein
MKPDVCDIAFTRRDTCRAVEVSHFIKNDVENIVDKRVHRDRCHNCPLRATCFAFTAVVVIWSVAESVQPGGLSLDVFHFKAFEQVPLDLAKHARGPQQLSLFLLVASGVVNGQVEIGHINIDVCPLHSPHVSVAEITEIHRAA